MKRVFLHSKRVFQNHWFIIVIAWAVSFVFGIAAFLLFLIYSMNFKDDPVDVNDILNNFTEEELAIILSDTIDENVSDDEYLQLQAKYQSQFCPKKVDHITTWMGSVVSGSAYIMYYEIKKNYQAIDKDVLRNNILTQINRGNVLTIRLARSHRNMVLRYTDSKSGDYFDIVIDNNELKAA